jgi:hypothetical protein
LEFYHSLRTGEWFRIAGTGNIGFWRSLVLEDKTGTNSTW